MALPVLALISFLVFLIPSAAQAATYYVDATLGNDANNGLTTDAAWKTVSKVNATAYAPGDSILFKRGETWLESTTLSPSSSGSAGSYITYGAYGTGEKPVLTTARSLTDPSAWQDEGNGVWRNVPDATGTEKLAIGDFATSTAGWASFINTAGGAAGSFARTFTAGEYDPNAAAGGGRVVISTSTSGTSDIQVYTAVSNPVSVESGKWYVLSFRAKANATTTIAGANVRLYKNVAPNTSYTSNTVSDTTITTGWASYTVLYKANATAADGRIGFFLGTVPSGTILYVDTVGFKEADNVFEYEVANLIFGDKEGFGNRKYVESELSSQGDYWYDISSSTYALKVRSAQNPATFYADGLLGVLRQTAILIINRSYLIFDGLGISMAGEHGYNAMSSNNIIIRNNDISYIGGGYYRESPSSIVRLGNGVQLWDSTHDFLVEKNRIWEVYDAALTTQGLATTTVRTNEYFFNNLVWNSEQGIETWQRPAGASVNGLIYSNNTIVDTGDTWSHSVRPNGSNAHGFMFSSSPATSANVRVINNAVVDSVDEMIRVNSSDPSVTTSALSIDHNYYANGLSSTHARNIPASAIYTQAQFPAWQAALGKDAHSIMDLTRTPGFVDRDALDFRLDAASPLIDAGTTTPGRTTDYLGNPIYGAPDIGAYEYQPPYQVGTDTVTVGSTVRIYGDEKFRDRVVASSSTVATLTVALQGSDLSQYVDVSISEWLLEGSFRGAWTETSSTTSLTGTEHVINDLRPSGQYAVSIDGAMSGISGASCVGSTCQADGTGTISFTYSGNYAAPRSFVVTGDAPAIPPVTADNSRRSGSSGQSAVRVVSPLADSVVKAESTPTSPITALILASRALFLSAQEKGIVLPAFILNVLGITGTASVTTPPVSIGMTFTRPLLLGSTGPDVSALQQILKDKGFYLHPEITGYYGPVTVQAVADFQKSLGLESLGYVGPATRAALNGN